MIPREQPGPLLNGLPTNLPDTDPEETNEWLESLDGLIEAGGRNRARFVMLKLNERARDQHVGVPSLVSTDYVNTIPKSREVAYPGDVDLEQDIRHMLRWNAAIQVHRQQRPGVGVGGHIASYASSATLYEVGLQHFWRGKDHPDGGDQIYFQGHSSPGMYARAFLEGRLSQADMDGFRQEYSRPAGGRGLPSYPHPRRMEDFWEFPTVSMGIGPINAIYQASFNKYLENRGIKDTSRQRVWAFLGDGEMDEVESRGALQHAANEGLDNLTFVINCNLQRLDGPVRGNGKIIQELEMFFRGAGWNVIKLIWGANWDRLLEDDGIEIAAEDLVQVVGLEARPMVAHAVLREVVGADPLAAIDRAHLGAPRVRRLLLCLLLGDGEKPGPQDPQGLFAVLQLALLVLAGDDRAGGQVGDAHRRVGRVDALSTGAGGTEDVDAQVVGIDGDIDLLGLREHEHARR